MTHEDIGKFKIFPIRNTACYQKKDRTCCYGILPFFVSKSFLTRSNIGYFFVESY